MTEEKNNTLLKEKIFNAVKMMREIRNALSRKYSNDPFYNETVLKKIRAKYTKLLEKQEKTKHFA